MFHPDLDVIHLPGIFCICQDLFNYNDRTPNQTDWTNYLTLLNVYLFILEGRGRERGRQEIQGRFCPARTKAYVGLELMNHEIMTRAKVGHSTDLATQAPHGPTI